MTTFTIELSDEQVRRLHELAQGAKVAPEQLLRSGVEEWLARPGGDFAEAAAHVLKKNRELYRRLA